MRDSTSLFSITMMKTIGPLLVDSGAKKVSRSADDRTRNKISIAIREDDDIKKIMLPYCRRELLLSPDAFVRGSLFGLGTHQTIQKRLEGKWSRVRERLHYPQSNPKECGQFGEVKISYIGEALDQGDLDVWLRLIDMAKENLTATISISFNQLLISMGRSCGGASYDNLNSSLERLSTGHIKLSCGDIKIIDGVALIKRFTVNQTTGYANIILNEATASLFSTNKNLGWTRIQREHREALIGQELALWLHAFYSSHARPIAYSVLMLHRMSGSMSVPKEFKRMLVGTTSKSESKGRSGALNELVNIGFLLSWRIEDNTVHVVRDRLSVTPSQLKFLASKT